MKMPFLNAITVDLIDKLDFVPAMNDPGTFLLSDKIRTFEKRELSEYTFLELIDLDHMSDNDIENHFTVKTNYLKDIEIIDFKDTPSLIEVFIMQKTISSKIETIKSMHNRAIDMGFCMGIIIIDMGTKDFIIDWGTLDPYPEIEFLMAYWLDNDASAFETLPDL
jgi:hypothetical protein